MCARHRQNARPDTHTARADPALIPCDGREVGLNRLKTSSYAARAPDLAPIWTESVEMTGSVRLGVVTM